MKSSLLAASCVLAFAACSTSEELEPLPDGGPAPDDASSVDAAKDDRSRDAGPDVERALACGDAGFCETRLPTTGAGVPLSLRAVWAVSPNDAWSVSFEGFVLHYDGAGWTTAYEANHALHAVWATATDVWVGGEGGLLLHKTGGGAFARVETNHLATIRSIYGASADDVWFTGRDDSLDHYDGSRLTNQPIGVSGFRLSTIFGRAGFGTYAAGYVKGPPLVPDAPFVEHVPYVFELTPSRITRFNTALEQQKGFVPVSAIVSDVADAAQRVWMFGYSDTGNVLYLKYSAFGKESPVALNDLAYLSVVDIGGNPSLAALPVWAPRGDSIYVPYAIGRIYHFAGTELEQKSLNMGYSFVPKTIFGMHGSGSDAWIVGDDFALKGVAP